LATARVGIAVDETTTPETVEAVGAPSAAAAYASWKQAVAKALPAG
jgi:hypothetical protein